MYLIFLEWAGAACALIGAALMALKLTKPSLSWFLWILSDILFMGLFSVTKQYSLLLMHVLGFFINVLGLYQWLKHAPMSKLLMKLFFIISVFCAWGGIFYLTIYLFYPTEITLSWSGALLGLAGAFILASRHEKAYYCWVFWLLSNFFILVVCIFYTSQFGLLLLQIGYSIINFIGLYNWNKIRKKINQNFV